MIARSWTLIMLLAILNVITFNASLTNAFYNDTENSSGNNWIAGALDFILSDSGFDPISASFNFESGTITGKTIGLALETDSNPIKYQASTTNVAGDVAFCNAINLNASLNGENQFSGNLTNFLSPTTTTIASWQYDFSMPTDSHFYNSVCSFDFEYNGRQTLPHSEYNDGGYYDIEKASSTIYSWGFRINKVYYDVGSDRGKDSANEWVEIYNQTDQSLDMTGWQICDNNECDTLASTSPIMIPAKGFGVITASSTTWNYWVLANNVVPILLSDTQIGGGLANSGDKLILKRPDGVVVDEMNWQTNTDIWNPGATDVAKGHTLARKPNGYDTNQASDFVDLAPPLVNLITPDQSGTLTWYWTYHYDINWLATNPNGPNSDLKINLSYIKDTDNSNTITPNDSIIPIAANLSNSGSYDWTVPSGFIGYIWVKINAFGPENPMLNSQMVSGKIYDPFPIELLFTNPELVIGSLIVTEAESATSTADSAPSSVLPNLEIILENNSSSAVPEEIMPLATTTPEIIVEIATSTPEITPNIETIMVTPEETVVETVEEAVAVEPVILPEPDLISAADLVMPQATPEPVVLPEPLIVVEPVI